MSLNFSYFKERINIIFEFIPQLLFLVLLFAYMAFLMIFKWIFYGPFDGKILFNLMRDTLF
jgi:V-type ATPase 116kDa subunit family